MQSTLTKVTRAQIKAERKKVMDSVRKSGKGGYVTDGRVWSIRTRTAKDGDIDILLEEEGRIEMRKIKEILKDRGECDVWIEGKVGWHENLKDYIDGNTAWEHDEISEYWTVELATQAEQ